MRLYIQEKNNLVKFNLPAKVDGSMLFSYKSSDSGIENSINIDTANGKWILKSNGNVNIVFNNAILPEIELEDYMCVPLSVSGRNDYICLFCLPSIEEAEYSYSIEGTDTVTIGKDQNNSIMYDQNMMLPNLSLIHI